MGREVRLCQGGEGNHEVRGKSPEPAKGELVRSRSENRLFLRAQSPRPSARRHAIAIPPTLRDEAVIRKGPVVGNPETCAEQRVVQEG